MIRRGASLFLASTVLLVMGAAAATPKKAVSPKPAGMSEDMREAIAFERAKDRADARQARLEARHPSVPSAPANAERTVEPNRVKDPGPSPKK